MARGNSETRYRYIYSDEEIKELPQRVSRASQKASLTFAFFNTHWQGYAPRNAIGLMKTLELPVKELPVQTALPEEDRTPGGS